VCRRGREADLSAGRIVPAAMQVLFPCQGTDEPYNRNYYNHDYILFAAAGWRRSRRPQRSKPKVCKSIMPRVLAKNGWSMREKRV
ncbi:MAG: hypothetical protein PHT27_06995, partial [Candidatus Izemoplasmatales bacterium]|nr:hypothetical protein [Candidatus Izemoplasmatales bacterium]